MKLLRQRLKQVSSKPKFIDPAREEKWTLHDMKAQLLQDYARKNNRSTSTMEHCLKHLEKAFEFHHVVDITAEKIREYANSRVEAKAARASVNRELAYLRRGFRLMLEAQMISTLPVIKPFDGENVRKGFINVAEFNSLLEKIPDQDVRDIVEFLYNSGWRSAEARRSNGLGSTAT